MDFIIEVRTGWGERITWLVKNCKSKEDAKQKLIIHYRQHINVDLSLKRSENITPGYYIAATDEVKSEVTEISDEYPNEL